MEKISWTIRVRNEETRQRVKEERNIQHIMKRKKANWIGHILGRNCLLKQVIEGKMEVKIGVKGIRGRRRKELLDDLNEKRGYCKLTEEVLQLTLWRTLWKSLWTYHKPDYAMRIVNLCLTWGQASWKAEIR
jgi:hypothetical protein